ncbi:MAG: hypothetical protein BWY31_00289 [Lentisphaerae bacterium ADurb.Bin242]|nr:MAG: hypothetical protein BWY31_00289 [Lentisphaerae bacterium ADurb.Bin242]
MKFIRFDSVGGAAGDMILASLAGLGADLKAIGAVLRAAIPEDEFVIETIPFSASGLNGLKLTVKITKSSGIERGLHEIGHIIDRAEMPSRAKELAHKVFDRLAEAEAHIHGCPVHHIHFHEVGAVDSIVDILGSCFALVQLGVDSVTFGVLPEGTGTFRCRHGVYPIPAPATLRLLEGIQIQQTGEPFEMITPTGAALLTTFPGGQDRHVSGRVLASSVSFGSRELKERPNILRATLLESDASPAGKEEFCCELETNLDDVTPELTGALSAKLFDRGALDVWLIPCTMKKQRSAVCLHVLCKPEETDALCSLIFRESGTLGIRVNEKKRRILDRDVVTAELSPGVQIRVKRAWMNGQVISEKPEYEDCLKVSRELDVPYAEVAASALAALKK